MTILNRLKLLINRFSPLEKVLLNAVEERLSGEAARLYRAQVSSINQVQRALDWEEIDFFCLRFRRFTRWNTKTLFPNRSEFVLARIAYKADEESLETLVWATRGHIFSLETEGGIKRHAFSRQIEVVTVTIADDVMEEKEVGPTRRSPFEEE